MSYVDMPHAEKVKHLRMALSLNSLYLPERELDLMVSTYELLVHKGSEARLSDVAAVRADIEARYPQAEETPEEPKTRTPDVY